MSENRARGRAGAGLKLLNLGGGEGKEVTRFTGFFFT